MTGGPEAITETDCREEPTGRLDDTALAKLGLSRGLLALRHGYPDMP